MISEILKTTTHYDNVKTFMEGTNQPTPKVYTVPTEAQRILRARLIMEETLELIIRGLGIDLTCNRPHGVIIDESNGKLVDNFKFTVNQNTYDPIELIDGVCDVRVTSTGALVDIGVPDSIFIDAVDDNNILKLVCGHTDPVTNKFIKPQNHPAPDILRLLDLVIANQQIHTD